MATTSPTPTFPDLPVLGDRVSVGDGIAVTAVDVRQVASTDCGSILAVRIRLEATRRVPKLNFTIGRLADSAGRTFFRLNDPQKSCPAGPKPVLKPIPPTRAKPRVGWVYFLVPGEAITGPLVFEYLALKGSKVTARIRIQ